jgi:hypothetical protein
MKKQFFILLIFLGMSQLNAETVVQIYPPSLFEFVSGRKAFLNVFIGNENAPMPSIFNLPVEVRQTIKGFSFADLMIAGGVSFYFEDRTLNSINLSSGLTFGYGYKQENEYFPIFRNANLTIYPLYEFPLVIFYNKTPGIWWKFAIDMSFELIQIRPISISMYLRGIGIYAKDSIWLGLFDCGLTVGWVF